MLKLKQTAIAVLALGSSAVFAGTMGPVCAPGNVTVPCEMNAWDFGARALYLKPTLNGDFAYFATRTVANNETYLDTNPNWGWGFEIEGSYHFSTGNDFNINWYHFSKNTNVNGRVLANQALPLARYEFKPQWDAVNFEFGQHVDFGDMKSIRFHGGAQWARTKLAQDLRAAVAPQARFEAANTSYNGFGPRLGADMFYGFGNGVGIFANAATAILAGSSKFNYTDYTVAPRANAHGSFTTVVPEVDAKLGANYTFALAQGDLTLDVAYMWVNYFDAIQQGLGQEADFGLNGIVFGGKWVGNIA